MKVFKVVLETPIKVGDKLEIHDSISFVAGDSLKQVTDHYTLHCEQYDEDLKSVSEVLTVVQDLRVKA